MDGVTWFGHSSVVIELDTVRLATDPVLTRRVAHLTREHAVPRAALGHVDALLVSHVHFDHLDVPSLRQFDRTLPVVVPRNAGSILRRRGFQRVLEVDPGESLDVRDVRVDVTPAEHGEVRRYVRARSSAVGYVVRGSENVYFAGDTDIFDGMRDLGPLDVALLPVDGWGHRLPRGHLDAGRAAEALTLLEPKTAVPIHWGTYSAPFAQKRKADPAETFRAAAARVAPDVRVAILQYGESLYL